MTTPPNFAAMTIANMPKYWRILAAGFAAGSLDLAYAVIAWTTQGVGPILIPQSIASGLIGSAAYQGGAATALLGAMLHFSMATAMAFIFYQAARRCEFIRLKPLWSGAMFGLCCYAAMNYIVVPLSAAVVSPPPGVIAITDIAAHIFLVGIPIALFVLPQPSTVVP